VTSERKSIKSMVPLLIQLLVNKQRIFAGRMLFFSTRRL